MTATSQHDRTTIELTVNGKPVNSAGKLQMKPDDTVMMETPGGGGYGNPAKRSPERIAADRAEGYLE
mgnify:CR=1 FL=1